MVQKTIRFLSEKFGGATATKAVGGWVCENGKLVTEDVTIVYSFCTEQQLHTEAHALIEWCKMIKKRDETGSRDFRSKPASGIHLITSKQQARNNELWQDRNLHGLQTYF